VCNGVNLLVENSIKYEAFKRDDKFEPWSQNNFDKLNENVLSKVCIKCSGMHPIIDYDTKMVFMILENINFKFYTILRLENGLNELKPQIYLNAFFEIVRFIDWNFDLFSLQERIH
jgi:hypothetical protein